MCPWISSSYIFTQKLSCSLLLVILSSGYCTWSAITRNFECWHSGRLWSKDIATGNGACMHRHMYAYSSYPSSLASMVIKEALPTFWHSAMSGMWYHIKWNGLKWWCGNIRKNILFYSLQGTTTTFFFFNLFSLLGLTTSYPDKRKKKGKLRF